MNVTRCCLKSRTFCSAVLAMQLVAVASWAQLTDRTQAPNMPRPESPSLCKMRQGRARRSANSWNSSIFIIQRDPFRSIRRGRQLFQRKFTRLQGQGANEGDGVGDLNSNGALGAGSPTVVPCVTDVRVVQPEPAAMSRPRPDSRDAPHLFGLGLKEMLADEITGDLRNIRATAIQQAVKNRRSP